jgi:hypothetical protein
VADNQEAIDRADELRRNGEITWEEYARLLHGKFGMNPAALFRGDRDRQGRLKELKDLGGR